jgi:hypothetical protein
MPWVRLIARLRRLGRHGVKQEAQRRLDILAVDATVFLIGDTRAVIDNGEQHQDRRTLPVCIDPGRCLQVLQIGRAHVEVPQRIRALGLEVHGRRLACHPLVIVAEAPQVAIDSRGGQLAWCQLVEAIRRVDAVLDQQLQGARRRQMATLSCWWCAPSWRRRFRTSARSPAPASRADGHDRRDVRPSDGARHAVGDTAWLD